jgi:hypothetical protein
MYLVVPELSHESEASLYGSVALHRQAVMKGLSQLLVCCNSSPQSILQGQNCILGHMLQQAVKDRVAASCC